MDEANFGLIVVNEGMKMANRRLSHADFVQSIPIEIANRVKVLGNYEGSLQQIKIKCLVHKAIVYPIASELKRGSIGCPQCRSESIRKARTDSNLIASLQKRFPEFTFKEITPGWAGRVSVICGQGHRYKSIPANLIRQKYGCRRCANQTVNTDKRFSKAKFLRLARQQQGAGLRIEGYTHTKANVKYWCDGCVCKTGKVAVARSLLHSKGCTTQHGIRMMQKLTTRKRIVIDGKRFNCMGYEDKALAKLAIKYKVKRLTVKHAPRVPYSFAGKKHVYVPDIHIRGTKKLIEVKSAYTLGLKSMRVFKRNRAKIKAARRAGYDIRVWVFADKTHKLTILPKNWTNMSADEVRRVLGLAKSHHRQ